MHMDRLRLRRIMASALMCIALIGSASALPSGIGGQQDGDDDVALGGCTCHASDPDNSITVILDGLPYHYETGKNYPLLLQIIGGPDADSSSHTGGFAMRVNGGVLSPADSALVQNWDGEDTALTHTELGSKVADRTWTFDWIAPNEEVGTVTIWVVGNAVNGDGAPSELDRWNRLSASVGQGIDNGQTRTVFSGNGEIEPPAPAEDHVDLHEMGAKLRAHWLGLLGFGAVIIVIVFCGFFLRYGFSRHYKGRSNLLRLRIKHLKRGDQL
mgnify:FL=1|tara:strand:+ start:69795 stop:70604 length:810 start_codon:yes stop_codon:yes gene_type:complete